MTDEDPLALDTRRRIFQHLGRHPGKYLRELQRDLGMAMGALEYHLRYLEKAGLVDVVAGPKKRFFPAEMDRREQHLLSFLREELPRRVLARLVAKGPALKAELLAALDVAPSTLNYHLKRLDESGLVRSGRQGREAAYEVTDVDRVTRLLLRHRTSFFDRLVDSFLDGFESLR